MRILIAEDDPVSRHLLHATLSKWGDEVIVTADGEEAWQALQAPSPPPLLILDWLMPKIDGVEICRRVRVSPALRTAHIILLTSRSSKEEVIQGLEAGADDYVTKPFDPGELHARVKVGSRIVQLQLDLAERLKNLQEALQQVKQLRGLLPICSYCKKIRDDHNYWHAVDTYVTQHADVRFSHGICPECVEKLRKEMA